MKSKAHFKGHPIHPILVGFPISFFAGALLFDALGIWYSDRFFQTGYYLNIAGLIAAGITAIPGIVDFLYTVPPKSSGKRRAAKHGLTNTAVIILFAASLWYRTSVALPEARIIIALEAAGFILLLFAGWMGGTLVYRNQIGVNPRYADAGKWKEEYLPVQNGVAEVHGSSGMKPNQMKLLHVAGKRIVLARTEESFVAFEDHCTHRGGSLAGGSMICGTVQCPWHGSQFSVKDGKVKAGPANENIRVYPLENINGTLILHIGD